MYTSTTGYIRPGNATFEVRLKTTVDMRPVASPLHITSNRIQSTERLSMSKQDPFTTITDELDRAYGGINMKLTQFGYPHDPYSDSETRKGHGAYHSLSESSIAMTDSGLRALGLSRSQVRSGAQWVDIKLKGGGVMTRRIDDRAPERDMRTDLYMPHGFNSHLGDRADISLHRG